MSALVNVYGPRPVCIGGAILAALAFVCGAMSSSIWWLMIAYGVGGGKPKHRVLLASSEVR